MESNVTVQTTLFHLKKGVMVTSRFCSYKKRSRGRNSPKTPAFAGMVKDFQHEHFKNMFQWFRLSQDFRLSQNGGHAEAAARGRSKMEITSSIDSLTPICVRDLLKFFVCCR
jgi:hypothetical protein